MKKRIKERKNYYLTIVLILLAVSISLMVTLTNQEAVSYENSNVKIVEKDLSATKKIISVDNPSDSRDFLIETELPKHIKSKNAQVKIVNTGKIIPNEDLNFIDEDEDGFFDKVSWNVPGGTDDSFEIELIILNPIEYLKDGDTWEVRFTTTEQVI